MWAEPSDACTSLSNADAARHRVVLSKRGNCPLVQKAASVQSAGGLGIIIVDSDGQCDKGFDQYCCPGADKGHGEGPFSV